MVKLCITSRCFVEISRWKLRQIEDTKSSYTKEQLEKRLAKLVGGVALIKVQLSVFFFPAGFLFWEAKVECNFCLIWLGGSFWDTNIAWFGWCGVNWKRSTVVFSTSVLMCEYANNQSFSSRWSQLDCIILYQFKEGTLDTGKTKKSR